MGRYCTVAVVLIGLLALIHTAPRLGADALAQTATRQVRSEQEMRDPLGNLIGTIRSRADERLEARDRLGRLLGHYDPQTDTSRDRVDRILYRGSALAALVVCSDGL